MTARSPRVEVARAWALEERRHVGPFVTGERYRLPDGSHLSWNSRRHRKVGRAEERHATLTHPWWQPRLLGWWIAVLFMIGSALFALGSFTPYANAVGAQAVGITYFVGSLFFTSAGYLQYLQAINAPTDLEGSSTRRRRFLAWQPQRIDWWAATVQSIGTLLFNRSTFNALNAGLSAQQQSQEIWRPDMLGSIAFMVASTLAWMEVCHGWGRWDPRDTSWRIVALNLGGSIAFQVSAIAAFVEPQSGDLVNATLATTGTLVGAIGFFFGALLLIPELAD